MAEKNISKTRMLTEAAIMLALATVLSIVKILELPYGGSVTVACMLPIVIIAYRHGVKFGLLTAFVFGVIQQIFGLKTLSYVTTWQSVVAVIALDYIVAFTVIGLGGVFRKMPSQANGLMMGTVLVCALRFLCHVISGATVWAGLSIPTNAALIYSIGYNATYMVPETIVTASAA
ncbi:MAG: energy-coupled thiamine transporter ThiT, partial [Clostridiales bacterium]|nr:energy-coupled thiamine transporter ThiT [Clostridiales bacterium]